VHLTTAKAVDRGLSASLPSLRRNAAVDFFDSMKSAKGKKMGKKDEITVAQFRQPRSSTADATVPANLRWVTGTFGPDPSESR